MSIALHAAYYGVVPRP